MNEAELAAAAAVEAALVLGVLDAIAAGVAGPATLAARCGLDRRLTVLLLDALVAAGAAHRSADGHLVLTDDRDVTRSTIALWRALPDALRSGRPVVDVSEPAAAATTYARMGQGITGYASASVPAVTAALAGLGPRVLDLGSGTAPWSRALAAADASLQVTAVDLPGVAALTERAVAAAGLSGQVTVLAGDAFVVDPGDGFDLVLVASLCRLFDEATNRSLLRRAASFVRPGGTVAVMDTLPDADRSDRGSVALYALGLALRTSRGGVHPFSSYAAWMHAAGLVGIDLHELPTPHLSLIRAGRPA